MKFTFGIITGYQDIKRLTDVVMSIRALNIPYYEIVVSGTLPRDVTRLPEYGKNAVHVLTDESEKPIWITRKKNLVAQVALYDNLVLLHDYFLFHPNWYQSYLAFGNEWDICSNPQLLLNGKRHFTDWVNWDDPDYPRYHSFAYDDWSHTKYQYISGGYFLVKRQFLQANPFNETMSWGQPEDVEWSLRVRNQAKIVCNPGAVVQHNKIHRDCR